MGFTDTCLDQATKRGGQTERGRHRHCQEQDRAAAKKTLATLAPLGPSVELA
jgi:hypothetical protein